jgi:sortase B
LQSVKSYEPRDKVAKPSRLCGFLKSKKKKTKKTEKSLNIKGNPKVIIKAIFYVASSGVLITILIISAYNIIRWRAENEATRSQLAELYSVTNIQEVSEEDEISTFIINLKENEIITSDDKYWDYIKVPLMDVDLQPTIDVNNDTAGWIQVPGTNIDYPYVQTDNNDFYLNHTLNRSWSSAGWVFLDYRNNKALNDRNQIIYAHGRYDGSMFGSLSTVLTPEWQANPENHIVKISTPYNNSIWQVFSIYQIKVTDDYLRTNFIDDTRFEEFIKLIKDRSFYDFNTNVSAKSQIITLSTCANGDERIVLHAKLIKSGTKQ